MSVTAIDKPAVTHRFEVGSKVVFTNVFGVCWGVRTIESLDQRNGPTYFLTPTDTPWFSTDEKHLVLADEADIAMSQRNIEEHWPYFQQKYGFTPTETYGCW